jgi:hypothetical protein
MAPAVILVGRGRAASTPLRFRESSRSIIDMRECRGFELGVFQTRESGAAAL